MKYENQTFDKQHLAFVAAFNTLLRKKKKSAHVNEVTRKTKLSKAFN